MAKRHLQEYYDSVCNDYLEMLDNIKDMEKEYQEGIIDPERLENIKKQIEPLKNNYMTLSWVMFLLNQPNRKSKEKKYVGMYSKKISELDIKRSPGAIKEENKKVIDKLKTL